MYVRYILFVTDLHHTEAYRVENPVRIRKYDL